jgi:hypothetical protein
MPFMLPSRRDNLSSLHDVNVDSYARLSACPLTIQTRMTCPSRWTVSATLSPG